MNLPEKLTSLRKQKGLTQQHLAETLNVSRQAISRWEVGTAVPSTDNLKILSNLYGLPVDYLLNDNTDDISTAQKNIVQHDTDYKVGKKQCSIWAYSILAAIVISAVVTAILIGTWHERRSTDIVPIEDMDSIVDDTFQTELFSLE